MTYNLISIGEILIDLGPAGAGSGDKILYQANPGGAPANVACVMAKLGGKAAFIGTVGDDVFGRICLNGLAKAGVDNSFIKVSGSWPTTLAAVCLDANGERSFSFYRSNTADLDLSLDHLPSGLFSKTQMLHFGSLSLSETQARQSTMEAVHKAAEAGCLISFDPNYRDKLWPDRRQAKKIIAAAAAKADILKLSHEEGELLFGQQSPHDLCRLASESFKNKMIVLTMAEKGAHALLNKRFVHSPAYQVKVVDTTGAGDAFLGALLFSLQTFNKELETLADDELGYALAMANAAGSLTTTKMGAIAAIPSLEEVKELLEKHHTARKN